MSQSTSRPSNGKPVKPRKPHADFLLTPHPSGRWCKKVRGKVLFFGKWDDPDGALAKWLAEKDYLLAGRKPPVAGDGLTIADLGNKFLTFKAGLQKRGELAAATFHDYHAACARLVAGFGKSRRVDDLTAEDFENLRAGLPDTWGPTAVGNFVQRARVAFRWAYESGLLTAPVRFGQGFRKPGKAVMRRDRAERPAKLFSRDELRTLLDAAVQPLSTMILLGVNAALGPADIGAIPESAVDLDAGILDFARPKTGIARRAILWPETIAAIRAWLAVRPEPKHEAATGRLFVTRFGQPWGQNFNSPVTNEFTKLLRRTRLMHVGRNFYSLRHTFRTVADETLDFPACNLTMGHTDNTMGGHYRARIDDSRLARVASHVRTWLFGDVVKG